MNPDTASHDHQNDLNQQQVLETYDSIEALVLFATETGTAHDAAERLVRNISLLSPYVVPRLVDMAEYPPVRSISIYNSHLISYELWLSVLSFAS
jgi:hypothetical protein